MEVTSGDNITTDLARGLIRRLSCSSRCYKVRDLNSRDTIDEGVRCAHGTIYARRLTCIGIRGIISGIFSRGDLGRNLAIFNNFIGRLLGKGGITSGLIRLGPQVLYNDGIRIGTINISRLLRLPTPLIIKNRDPISCPIGNIFPDAYVLFRIYGLVDLKNYGTMTIDLVKTRINGLKRVLRASINTRNGSSVRPVTTILALCRKLQIMVNVGGDIVIVDQGRLDYGLAGCTDRGDNCILALRLNDQQRGCLERGDLGTSYTRDNGGVLVKDKLVCGYIVMTYVGDLVTNARRVLKIVDYCVLGDLTGVKGRLYVVTLYPVSYDLYDVQGRYISYLDGGVIRHHGGNNVAHYQDDGKTIIYDYKRGLIGRVAKSNMIPIGRLDRQVDNKRVGLRPNLNRAIFTSGTVVTIIIKTCYRIQPLPIVYTNDLEVRYLCV